MVVLIVDGYNIIGAWPELRKLREKDFAQARDKLIAQLAEYQAYTGERVIVVFDAHFVKGIEKKEKASKVDVFFTRENETADERIEKLAGDLTDVRTKVYVATSDFTEQRTIFAQGAYRKSARELKIEMDNLQKSIAKDVEIQNSRKYQTKIPIKKDVRDVFEKWRRGEK